jgi:hypothetical protein
VTEHTVTIVTADHGPVTVPCPLWCTREDHAHGGLRSDIVHYGPETTTTVTTPDGPRELISLALAEAPFDTDGAARVVHVAVCLATGDSWTADAAGLDALAVDLIEAAGTARYMARRLAAETRGGEQR